MWTYSDYITYAYASSTFLTRLRLHIKEVTDKIDTEMAADAKSESANNLTTLRDKLVAELREAERSPAAATNGGISRVRFGRA